MFADTTVDFCLSYTTFCEAHTSTHTLTHTHTHTHTHPYIDLTVDLYFLDSERSAAHTIRTMHHAEYIEPDPWGGVEAEAALAKMVLNVIYMTQIHPHCHTKCVFIVLHTHIHTYTHIVILNVYLLCFIHTYTHIVILNVYLLCHLTHKHTH